MKIKSTLTKEYFILLKQKLFLQTLQSVWQTLLRTQIKRHPIMTDSHRVFKWVWVIFFFIYFDFDVLFVFSSCTCPSVEETLFQSARRL